MKKGDRLVCDNCGLAVTVCDECDCETQEILCCGAPMTKRRSARKTPVRKSTKRRRS